MDNTGKDLLRLILKNPQEDLHRLVYADWLEEGFRQTNDPATEARAEFIRLQVLLASQGNHPDQRQFYRREQHLKQMYGAAWAGDLIHLAADWNYRRGFIHHLQVDARTFIEIHDSLEEKHPLEHLHLFWGMETPHERAEDLRKIAALPLVLGLASIDLTGAGVGSDGVANLVAGPSLENLRELNLAGNRIGPRGLKAILSSPWMAGIRKLDLADNDINHQGVRVLHDFLTTAGETGEILSLERIDLRGNPIRVTGARLLRSPALARLVRW